MKMKCLNYLKIFTISVLLAYMSHAKGQDFILGLKYGFGSNTFIRQSDSKKTSAFATHKVGLVAEFSPYYSRVFIISGMEYEINELGNSIAIPISIRITFGNTIRPFVEGGGYYNYSLTDLSEDFSLKNDLGAQAKAGLLLNLNKHVRLELGYTYRFGITTALEEEIILPLEQIMLEEYRRKSGSLDFCIKYRF